MEIITDTLEGLHRCLRRSCLDIKAAKGCFDAPHISSLRRKMDKQDITPSLRPEVNRTVSDLEKATVKHVEQSRPGISALEDEVLMSGERQERVSSLPSPLHFGLMM